MKSFYITLIVSASLVIPNISFAIGAPIGVNSLISICPGSSGTCIPPNNPFTIPPDPYFDNSTVGLGFINGIAPWMYYDASQNMLAALSIAGSAGGSYSCVRNPPYISSGTSITYVFNGNTVSAYMGNTWSNTCSFIAYNGMAVCGTITMGTGSQISWSGNILTSSGTGGSGSLSFWSSGPCSSPPVAILPDLTAGATTPTPSSVTAGQAQLFSSNVTNTGVGTASNFPNVFQIANNDLSVTIARVNTGSIASLAAGASIPISGSYTFSSPGTYNVRACANMDTSGNVVVIESDTGNNCGAWTTLTVLPPITVSCSVSPDAGNISDSFTWKATASGGSGPYTYKWSGDTDPASSPVTTTAPTNSITTQYTTAGIKNVSVMVTDGTQSSPNVYCTNSTYVSSGPNGPTSPGSSTGTSVVSVTLSANPDGNAPNTVVEGQSINLTWSSQNAISCTGSGFDTGNATGGTQPNTAPTVYPSTNYAVTCKDSRGNSVTKNVTVPVQKPNITITANPPRVSSGSSSTIAWDASYVNSCTVTNTTTGAILAKGSADAAHEFTGSDSSGPITQQTVFTITCNTDGSRVSSQVIVNLRPIFREF
jgi:hypothetical protein